MLYCSYHEAMFSAEPVKVLQGSAVYYELQAACFHEAAHAVAAFFFGEGCASVEVTSRYLLDQSGQRIGVDHTGCAKIPNGPILRVRDDLRKEAYTVSLAAHGIAIAVGPAAERRFRIENDMPLHLVTATVGDHHDIQTIVTSLERGGRSGAAFTRLIWRSAYNFVMDDELSECIGNLAMTIIDCPTEENSVDCERYFLTGEQAIEIMKYHLSADILSSINLRERKQESNNRY